MQTKSRNLFTVLFPGFIRGGPRGRGVRERVVPGGRNMGQEGNAACRVLTEGEKASRPLYACLCYLPIMYRSDLCSAYTLPRAAERIHPESE